MWLINLLLLLLLDLDQMLMYDPPLIFLITSGFKEIYAALVLFCFFLDESNQWE